VVGASGPAANGGAGACTVRVGDATMQHLYCCIFAGKCKIYFNYQYLKVSPHTVARFLDRRLVEITLVAAFASGNT